MDTINETRDITTPSGKHKLVVRSYITGEDRRDNRRLILKIHDDGKSGTVEGIEMLENASIERVVISVDGSTEKIVDQILKFEANDYDFVVDTVNEVLDGMSKKNLRKSDTSTETTSMEEKQD